MFRFPDTPTLHPGKPEGFQSTSKYCTDEKWLGTLKAPDGSPLNKNIRNRYYPKVSGKHIAKTPPQAIRWAIAKWTKKGQGVLDPFMGSGTTGAEALLQDRWTIGVELEFCDIARNTLSYFDPSELGWELYEGDAEHVLNQKDLFPVHLVNFSNPYRGRSEGSPRKLERYSKEQWTKGTRGAEDYQHKFGTHKMSETEYLRKMGAIQEAACRKLAVGGHAVFVIKDPMYRYKSSNLHEKLADLLPSWMVHIGTFALPHYPETLFMRSYPVRFNGIRPSKEQICPVFKKIK